MSEVTVDKIERARKVLTIVSVQNLYNVTNRKWEDEVEYSEREGLAFIPWFPLSAGAVDHPVLNRVAARHGASVFQVALAWLLEHSPSMLVIPGTSSVEHLEQNVAAAEIRLSKADMEELNAIG
jgi:aryl-alcohol dehydrogenase-like predicted oxidoreductase